MILTKLDWDSVFFEKAVFKCEISKLSEFNEVSEKLPNNSLCYFFTKNKIEEIDGLLVDQKVIFQLQSEKFGLLRVQNEKIECTTAKQNPIAYESLKYFAIVSSQNSRFRKDPFIPNCKVDELYSLWIKKAFDQQGNHEIFLAFSNGRLVGMISCLINTENMVLELVATDPSFQGKGVGSLLMESVLAFGAARGIKCYYVTTQLDNSAACGLYKKHGFSVDNIAYVYHFHK